MFINKEKPSKIYNFSDSIHGSHRKIIDTVGRNKKVLDVGCAGGYLAKEFKNNNCSVVGIEQDVESVNAAKGSCEAVLSCNVEEIEKLSYPDNYFDVIVFADILEHLKEPEKALLVLKRYLNPEGFIIASIPNVARLDVRWKLLLGRFYYEDAGIMDKTHLRFFTLLTAKKLFLESGYKIINVDYTGIASMCRLFPAALAFQFIITAKKDINEPART